MNSISMLLKSKTFWTLVAIFCFNGFQAIEPSLDPSVQTIVNAVLMLLASYFHINPSQSYHGSQLTKDQ